MAHHPLSMSNWPAWELCPCKEPGGAETEEAKSGSRSHSWLKYLIDCYVGREAVAPAGVTADERARAEWAFGQVSAVMGSYKCDGELQVRIEGHDELDGIEGTCDVSAVMQDRIVVLDYKTYSMNACDLTAQPVGYGLAIASALPFPPDKIEAYILHGGSREVERVEVSVKDALERAHKIIRSRLDDGGNLGKASPNHFCQYCPRLSSCPATDRALAVVQDEAKFVAMPLAHQLVIAKQVKSICERVEKDVKRELDRQISEGTGVEDAVVSAEGVSWHYHLKPGAEVLGDILGLANEVAKHGIDQARLVSLASISKTKLCDVLVEANPSMKVADAKRVIKPFYTPGKPSKWLEKVA